MLLPTALSLPITPAFLQSATDLFAAGGWAMVPLAAVSVLTLALVLERAAFWARTHGPGSTKRYTQAAQTLRSPGDAPADPGQNIYARFAGAVASRIRGGHAPESAAVEVIELLRPAVERSSATLSAIVTGAPLLGILGTVSGIISSFQLLGGDQAVTDPTLVAAGIAEALITTAVGLTIALVALLPHAVYRGQAERCLARLEALGAAAEDGRRSAS
ncbi:MAG: MotA/TolQ/ExbB proton channel family protein [Planctomycetota bacterium]